MNQEQLKTFITVATYLNFSEAAKRLYLTQPTVSHQISALESELNTPLFIRAGRDVSLTKGGKLFLEDAKEIFGMTEDAIEHLRLAKENPDLMLRIAYLLAPCQSFLPPLVMRFRKEYPQVELLLYRMNAHEISQALSSERYDLYFSMCHDLADYTQYARKVVFQDTMCMILPNSHPCAVRGKIDYSLLASEPFLTLNPDVGPYVENQALRFCHSNNYYPPAVTELDSFEEILFDVTAGCGITILPGRSQLSYLYPLTYIPLDGKYAMIDIGVAWKENTENPAVSWFLELAENFTPNPPPPKNLTDGLSPFPSIFFGIFSVILPASSLIFASFSPESLICFP